MANVVERLASRSLVVVDHERAEPRLHILEPVRQYAAERLREAGEHDWVVRRHLEWALLFAVKAGLGIQRELRRWSTRLRDEQDNIHQAMEHALAAIDPEAHRCGARLPVVQHDAAQRVRVGRTCARRGPWSARADPGLSPVGGWDAGSQRARLRPGPAEARRQGEAPSVISRGGHSQTFRER